jgi:hypothetical protein
LTRPKAAAWAAGVCQRTDGSIPVDETALLKKSTYKEHQMLETVAILLLIFWALGLVSSYTLGGFIHILLVIAVVVILVRLIRGRSPL